MRPLHIVKVLSANFIFYTGILFLIRRAHRNRAVYPILMYHHVSEKEGIPPAVFQKQMAYVRKNYTAMPLGQLLKQQKNGTLSKNSLAVTFDDGHRDFLTEAYPVLKENNILATLFAVTDCLDGKPLWTKSLKGYKTVSMLTWSELKNLCQDCVEVGAHTVNHRILTEIPLEEARREIYDSKRILEERLGKTVDIFCYPNGQPEDFNSEIEKIVQETGYVAACTTLEGKNDETTNRYALKRMAVWERCLPLFACELEGCFDVIRWPLRHLKKQGFQSWVKEILERLWMTRIYILLERDFKSPFLLKQVTEHYEFGWLREEEKETLTRLQPDLTLEKIEGRLRRGDGCFAARDQNKLISYIWVAKEPHEIWDIRGSISLAPKQFYLYNSRTVPEYRGLEINPMLVLKLQQELEKEGGKSFLSAIFPENVSSLRARTKIGFVQTAYFCYRKRLFWTKRERIDFKPTTPISRFHIFRRKKTHMMAPVIVIGQGRTGLGVNRLLGQRGIPIIKIGDDPHAIGARSRYGDFEKMTLGNSEGLLSVLKNISGRYRSHPVLIPTSDEAVLWISEAREALQKISRFILPEKGVIEMLLDKGRFAEEASRLGFQTPATKTATGEEDLKRIVERISFPCLVKPTQKHTFEEKAWIATSEKELLELSSKCLAEGSSCVVQEMIPGDDSHHWSAAVYLDREGKVLGTFTARKIRQYPPFLGIGAICESVWNERAANEAVSLLRKMNYVGAAEVEFKEDSRTGALNVIEVNPRLWIQHALAARCGIDFAFLVYLESLGIAPEPLGRQQEGVRWVAFDLDLLGVRQRFHEGKISAGEWLGAYHFPIEPALFRWDDPRPGFSRMRSMMGQFLGKHFHGGKK
ncbi:MAG: GNAT family N-acetyltransferase [Candidatus Omnitrophota bacterium]